MICIKAPVKTDLNISKFVKFLNSKELNVDSFEKFENYTFFVLSNSCKISQELKTELLELKCDIYEYSNSNKNMIEIDDNTTHSKIERNLYNYISSLSIEGQELARFDVIVRTNLPKYKVEEKFKDYIFEFYPNLGSTIVLREINANKMLELAEDESVVSIRIPIERKNKL